MVEHKKSCSRKLSALEEYHWKFSSQNNCNIGITLNLERPIDLAVLEKSANLLKQKHFLCRSYVDTHTHSLKETKKSIPLSVNEVSDEDIPNLLHENLEKPFLDDQNPLIRISQFIGLKSFDLQIVMHHSISDGVSLINIAREILSNTSASCSTSYCPTSSKKTSCSNTDSTSTFTSNPNDDYKAHYNNGFIYRKIKKNDYRKLFANIKKTNSNFHSLFSAVLLKAVDSLSNSRSTAINYICPINLRPCLNIPPSELGCLIWVYSTEILPQKYSLASLQRKLTNSLSEYINTDQIWKNLSSEIKDHREVASRTTSKNQPLVGVSNLGLLDRTTFEITPIKQVFIDGTLSSILSSPNSIHAIILTYDDTIHINFAYSKLSTKPEVAESIVNRTFKLLMPHK